ncbi:MAG: DUF116 domain-containing protein [Candidatus Thermoplasmatota archaeon]
MNEGNGMNFKMSFYTSTYPLAYTNTEKVFITPTTMTYKQENSNKSMKEATGAQVQAKGEINYEKKNFTLGEFEKALAKDFVFDRLSDSCYIINGTKKEKGEKIIPQKSFGFIPYCLKPLNCPHRLGYDCHNFDQEICKHCNAKKLIDFYESRGIPYYHIIRDDEDVPRAIKLYNEKYGDFDAVIAVSCPRAVLENKRFIQKYSNVSVIFVSLIGWNDCNIKKALQGKWWGETSLDIGGLQEACDECLSSSQSTLRLDR